MTFPAPPDPPADRSTWNILTPTLLPAPAPPHLSDIHPHTSDKPAPGKSLSTVQKNSRARPPIRPPTPLLPGSTPVLSVPTLPQPAHSQHPPPNNCAQTQTNYRTEASRGAYASATGTQGGTPLSTGIAQFLRFFAGRTVFGRRIRQPRERNRSHPKSPTVGRNGKPGNRKSLTIMGSIVEYWFQNQGKIGSFLPRGGV
jgi:hypothetical protein